MKRKTHQNQQTMGQTFGMLVGAGVGMSVATQDMATSMGIAVAIFGTAMIFQSLRKDKEKRG
ncbi:MAG: hypothetical protein AAFV98_14560 [Chloroflexota bacterium]